MLDLWQCVAILGPMKALDTQVREALEKRRGYWRQVEREAGISYSWLSKFARGCIKNPGVETLKKLQTYFKTSKARRA